MGGRLCGAVRFTAAGPLPCLDACHCTACRRSSWHCFASTDAPKVAVAVEGKVRWHSSSDKVRRGFCATCGSSLFWDPVLRDWVAIDMGTFGGPTGAQLAKHIFTVDQGDYYEISDGLPQHEA